jgi:hypothetical protein
MFSITYTLNHHMWTNEKKQRKNQCYWEPSTNENKKISKLTSPQTKPIHANCKIQQHAKRK